MEKYTLIASQIVAAIAFALPAIAQDGSQPPSLMRTDPWTFENLTFANKFPILSTETTLKAEFDQAQSERLLLLSEKPEKTAPAGNDSDLAKKLSNPVSDLISIPFQFNYDEGYGPKDASVWKLNVQPVIPFSLGKDWNMITRTIVPLIYQESIADGVDSQFGMGDTLQSFFFSPKQPIGGWIVGAGPVFNWPTATDDQLGSGKWAAGPTAVILKQDSGWTYGILANHLWSFAGDSDRNEINATFLQPFLSYAFPSATTIGLNAEMSYDWTSSQWTIPINLSVSQLTRMGKLPVQLSLGCRWYAESPDNGPEWGVRFTITIMLPN